MPRTRLVVATLFLAALTASAVIGVSRRSADLDTKPRVRLAVLLVFDQLRGDYVERWQPQFGPDGFVRMQDQGAWFANCHYPYATTTTGPGHASILTGCSADRHGIISNEWYDREAGQGAYCAGTDRYEFVPAPAKAPKTSTGKKALAGTPDRLMAPSIGDVLKKATNGQGKVFGVSLKDRSAIFPTGKSPDGAYWFNGKFVTSTYYRDTPHAWVERFNNSGMAEKWFGKTWNRLRTELDYEALSGPDDMPGEASPNGLGMTFPRTIDGGKAKIEKAYYDALATSPFGNELVWEFAKTCIQNEKLGQDDVPDLMTISFSSNDLIGHAWGPDSQEVLDVTLRSDRLVAEILRYLDERVGRGNYIVALSADHGICPLPEVSAKRGVDAQRIMPAKILAGAEAHLQATFGKPMRSDDDNNPKQQGRWIENTTPPWFYLNHRQIQFAELSIPEVASSLKTWLEAQPGIHKAFTLGDLVQAKDDGQDPLAYQAKLATHRQRSGDVLAMLKPYYLLSDPVKGTGTTHGSPHPYDSHVPLLVYGPDIPGGRRDERVTPQHTAAIFARFLGIDPPSEAQYPVPDSLTRKP